jgi:hypothetical protein
MLSSITPLGERTRGNIWSRAVIAFVLASALAGILVGAVLGSLGSLLHPQPRLALVILGAVSAAGLLLDVGWPKLRLPTIRRQVNRLWMEQYRDWVYGAGYGLQLGAGLGTIVSTSAVYSALVAGMLVAEPRAGALVGGVFGLVRGMTILAGAVASDADRLMALHRRLERGRAYWHRFSISAQASLSASVLIVGVASL